MADRNGNLPDYRDSYHIKATCLPVFAPTPEPGESCALMGDGVAQAINVTLEFGTVKQAPADKPLPCRQAF